MASSASGSGRYSRIAVTDLIDPLPTPPMVTHVPGWNYSKSVYAVQPPAPPPPTRYASSSSSIGANSAPSPTAMHNPRAPRPSYSEEQKFYIMFSRIMRDEKWEDIELRFSKYFGCSRSRGGLTSVYYRIRRDWGMREVLKSGPAYYPNDIKGVQAKAHNFSRDFLLSIGYPLN